MGKDRSDSVWNTLQDAWDRAIARIEKRRDQKRRKHEEWVDRRHEKVSRRNARTEKNEDVIERLEQQIAHCEGLRDDARSDDFASEVQGWIDEKQDKIRDTMGTNGELEDRVRELQRKPMAENCREEPSMVSERSLLGREALTICSQIAHARPMVFGAARPPPSEPDDQRRGDLEILNVMCPDNFPVGEPASLTTFHTSTRTVQVGFALL